MTRELNSSRFRAFQVPQHDEDPGEDMIDWLGTCPHEWSGDESGVHLAVGAGGDGVVAGPGDWIVQSGEQWFVVGEGSTLELACMLQEMADRTIARSQSHLVSNNSHQISELVGDLLREEKK